MAWGELFGLLVMLAALFGMSAVLARRAGVGSAAAPLAALALAELVLLASGLLGVLRPAGLALAALGLLGGGLEAALAKKKGKAAPLLRRWKAPPQNCSGLRRWRWPRAFGCCGRSSSTLTNTPSGAPPRSSPAKTTPFTPSATPACPGR